MREVARLGFILVGIHITLSGVQGVATFFWLPVRDASEFTWALLGVQLLLVVAPGASLVLFNRTLSVFLFEEQPAQVAGTDLVAAGVAVLGAYLVVMGLSGASSFLLLVGPFGPSWGTVLSAILQAAFGAVLFRYPRAVLRRLGAHAA